MARDKLTVSKWSSERCREGLAVAMPVGICICTCSGRLENSVYSIYISLPTLERLEGVAGLSFSGAEACLMHADLVVMYSRGRSLRGVYCTQGTHSMYFFHNVP